MRRPCTSPSKMRSASPTGGSGPGRSWPGPRAGVRSPPAWSPGARADHRQPVLPVVELAVRAEREPWLFDTHAPASMSRAYRATRFSAMGRLRTLRSRNASARAGVTATSIRPERPAPPGGGGREGAVELRRRAVVGARVRPLLVPGAPRVHLPVQGAVGRQLRPARGPAAHGVAAPALGAAGAPTCGPLAAGGVASTPICGSVVGRRALRLRLSVCDLFHRRFLLLSVEIGCAVARGQRVEGAAERQRARSVFSRSSAAWSARSTAPSTGGPRPCRPSAPRATAR